MSECSVATIVPVASSDLPRLLNRYFRIRGNSDGDTLRIPVTIEGPFETRAQTVTVNIQPRAQARATEPTYSIFIAADDARHAPPFCGVLTLARGPETDSSEITITGGAQTSLGLAGIALEAVMGRSVVRATAEAVLGAIAFGVTPATLAYA